MRNNLFLCLTVFLFFTCISYSQNFSENAIGIRLGESQGFGSELSYQRAIQDRRIEIDLGFRRRIVEKKISYRLTIIHHWVWDINPHFSWFVGVGGGAGNWKYTNNDKAKNNIFGFAVGNIGIESNFDLPLQLALDLRPQLGLINYGNESLYDIAASVRYRF